MPKEKPNLRAPTETRSCRLTDSGCAALDEVAEDMDLNRSDTQRVILVEALRARRKKVVDARVDRALEAAEC